MNRREIYSTIIPAVLINSWPAQGELGHCRKRVKPDDGMKVCEDKKTRTKPCVPGVTLSKLSQLSSGFLIWQFHMCALPVQLSTAGNDFIWIHSHSNCRHKRCEDHELHPGLCTNFSVWVILHSYKSGLLISFPRQIQKFHGCMRWTHFVTL